MKKLRVLRKLVLTIFVQESLQHFNSVFRTAQLITEFLISRFYTQVSTMELKFLLVFTFSIVFCAALGSTEARRHDHRNSPVHRGFQRSQNVTHPGIAYNYTTEPSGNILPNPLFNETGSPQFWNHSNGRPRHDYPRRYHPRSYDSGSQPNLNLTQLIASNSTNHSFVVNAHHGGPPPWESDRHRHHPRRFHPRRHGYPHGPIDGPTGTWEPRHGPIQPFRPRNDSIGHYPFPHNFPHGLFNGTSGTLDPGFAWNPTNTPGFNPANNRTWETTPLGEGVHNSSRLYPVLPESENDGNYTIII